jgi:hypothetical protein
LLIIPALGRLRQEDCEFEACLGYVAIQGRKGRRKGGRQGGRERGREGRREGIGKEIEDRL